MSTHEYLDGVIKKIVSDGSDPREFAIPIPSLGVTTASYRSVAIEKVRISFKGRELPEESYYRRESQHHPLYRKRFEDTSKIVIHNYVYEHFLAASRYFEQFKMILKPLDGYRPLAVQSGIRQAYIDLKTAELGSAHLAELNADKYFSRAPDQVLLEDPTTWYAHSTGGAVDFTLCSDTGWPLEMGAIFDDMTELSQTWYYEVEEPVTDTARAARENRRMLFWGMLINGWVNYPNEYFHFDYLDSTFRTQFGVSNASTWHRAHYQTATVEPCVS